MTTTRRGRRCAATPTLSDVAESAGVSYQTVSRVVNQHPHVAAATRERVERAIADLGYRPNPSARALATGTAIATSRDPDDVTWTDHPGLLRTLERTALQAGYALRAVPTTGYDDAAAVIVLTPLGSRGPASAA